MDEWLFDVLRFQIVLNGKIPCLFYVKIAFGVREKYVFSPIVLKNEWIKF